MGLVFWLSLFFIFYSYAGYPLLVFLLARLRPPLRLQPLPKEEQPSLFPAVTLLIAAYNEEKVLAQKLENSLALEYPPQRLQILVAADGSTDTTPEIVRSFASSGVQLSYSPERSGKMAAIDHALEKARGEIILMSDANNLYPPDALRWLVAPFRDDPSVGATGGAKHVLEGDGVLGDSEGAYWKYESWLKRQETRLGCATGAAGEANALRRSLYVSPPRDTINDDYFLMTQVLRQGFRVVYVPQARSYERVSASAQDEVERRARIVAGRYQAMARSPQTLPWKHPLWLWQLVSHKYSRPLVPFAMLTAFGAALWAVLLPPQGGTSLAWLWLAFPWNGLILAAQVLFYLLAWLGNRLGDRAGLLGRLLYLLTFLVNSNLAALYGFWRFITRRQKTQWKRAQRRGEA